MSRVLLGWELGRNLGHLARLVPLAMRLKSHGHTVVAAVRDVASAATMLGRADIPFVASPLCTGAERSIEGAVSFADLLLSYGWNDPSALWGLLRGWTNLYQLFEPDVVVLDYAPTAQLAARLLGIPCALVGSGFVLPPSTQPLPAFPDCPWATPERAEQAERRVLQTVQVVLTALRARPLTALRELFEADEQSLTTFPELDPYGARPDARYVGPLAVTNPVEGVDWPDPSARRRVVAYLRPEVRDAVAVLEGLVECGATVMCYAPGIAERRVNRLRSARIHFAVRPLPFDRLFAGADACLSYSPAATVASSLLHGVPQILVPMHIEAYLTARRVEALGAGLVLHGAQTPGSAAAILDRFFGNGIFKVRAAQFADRYRHHDAAAAADDVVDRIEAVARQASAKGFTSNSHMSSQRSAQPTGAPT